MCIKLVFPSVDQYETPAAVKREIINCIEYNSTYWNGRYGRQPTSEGITRLTAVTGGRLKMVQSRRLSSQLSRPGK